MSKSTNPTTVDFTNGFVVSGAGSTVTVDGSGFLRTTGNQSASGDKTFSGSTTFTGTVTNSNATTTGTNTSIGTGNGLTSGQALSVSTGSSTFGTGSGTGFFYGGASDSYAGAVTISNTGAFTGTLLALTADATTSGTVLGISAQSLTSGKAIDVMLGTLYSGTSDAQGTIGAVNVRAQSFTGNVFNVSASGAGGPSANLANFQSTQLAGNVVNVSGISLTTGTAVSVLLGTSGTGELINTAAGYTGNLLDLRVNNTPVFSVNQAGDTSVGGTLAVSGNATVGGTLGVAGNTTLGGTLGVAGDVRVNTNKLTIAAATGNITGPNSGGWTIDNGNASAINIGTGAATTINIGRTGQSTVVGGALTSTQTFIVGPGAPNQFSVSSTTGNVTAQGTGQFGSSSANSVNLSGAANGSPVVLSAIGATDPSVGITLAPKGAGRVTISGSAGGGLDVAAGTNANVVVGSANRIELVGAASGSAPALQINSGSTDANVNLALTARGSGRVLITTGGLTVQSGDILGPTSGVFSIDNSNASAINIGGATATTLNLGRSGQTQALLGNVTVAGTLGVTGATTLSSTLAVTGNVTVNTNRLTINAATGNITGPSTGAWTIDNGNASAINIGTATATGITLGRTGQTLTVNSNTQLNGTLRVGSAGSTAFNTIEIGTCAGANATTTTCNSGNLTGITAANLTTTDVIIVTSASNFTNTRGCVVENIIAGTSFEISCNGTPGVAPTWNVMVVRR